MKRFKAGLFGTIIILVILGNFISVVAPVPQVATAEVKLAGHTTPIVVIAGWVANWFASINWSTSGYNPNYPPYLQEN